MKVRSEWVLNISWLLYPLTLWLKLPNRWRVRVILPAVFICGLSVVGYAIHLTSAQSAAEFRGLDLAHPLQSVQPTALLPELSSVALLDLTKSFVNPEVNQQNGQFNLNFLTNWRNFAEFSHQVAHSNLAPQSYRMQWPPLGATRLSAMEKEFSVQLQLAPGVYRVPATAPVPWLPQNNTAAIRTPEITQTQCPAPPFPDFILQASWPSRGYIQILLNGRGERIEINQLLGNSWQLRRIGSDSLRFSWHNANATCHKEKTITVAI